MGETERIKRLVTYYVRQFGTRDPFKIADQIGVLYQIGNCKNDGCYMFLKKHRYIFLSNQLEESELKLVMAHELGHAVLHPRENCYFIRNKTLLLNSRTEIEANKFAMELLIPDDVLEENKDFTTEQLSRLLGYEQELIDLRIKSYYDLS